MIQLSDHQNPSDGGQITKPHVLVVLDDDPNIVELIEFAAGRMGFEVYTAVHATQFQEIVLSNTPSVVILDVIMPDMDGTEVVNWLVEQEIQAPIILMSGFDGRYLCVVKSLGLARGANIIGTLAKPFSLEKLKTTLSQLV